MQFINSYLWHIKLKSHQSPKDTTDVNSALQFVKRDGNVTSNLVIYDWDNIFSCWYVLPKSVYKLERPFVVWVGVCEWRQWRYLVPTLRKVWRFRPIHSLVARSGLIDCTCPKVEVKADTEVSLSTNKRIANYLLPLNLLMRHRVKIRCSNLNIWKS